MKTRKYKKVHGGGIFISKNKGFSLVELVVVIAIMAVLIAVLAPALLQYTEKSRAQKDDSAMDEVVNSVQLAMSEQNCYDELIQYNEKGNVSCYIDTNKEGDHNNNKEITKIGENGNKDQYTFGNDSRLLDETPYYAAGNMRGVTITFSPDITQANFTYDIKNGVINKFGKTSCVLEDLPTLYNKVRQSIGDTITINSQTYRNSEYTIFIVIGSTGGNQSSAQDAITVYGQFSGTNLPSIDTITYSRASSGWTSSFVPLSGWYDEYYSKTPPMGEFQFDEGMTWAEWCDSEYNTYGIYVSSNTGEVHLPGVGEVADTEGYKGVLPERVHGNDVISSEATYGFMPTAAGGWG